MISITLPSIRPRALRRALDNIERATRGRHEVIVVGEEETGGANVAHARAFERATGEFVVAWVDDHLFIDGWDVEVETAFRDREGLLLLGLRHVEPQFGTCFGMYYPYFPMMRRADVVRVGGWLSADYRIGFADVDLAMRVWSAGGRCEPSSSGVVVKCEDDDRKLGSLFEGEIGATEDDVKLFLSRWAKRYGAGFDLSSVRGFNRDRRDYPP